MAVTQYVGPKIVPHGFTDWNATTAYDGLYCAYYGYQWYIACNGPVPVGVSPVDREYWAPYSLNSGDIQNITAKVNSLFPTVPLSEGTDLNTITEPGNYMLHGESNAYKNAPIELKSGSIMTVRNRTLTDVIQIITSSSSGIPYILQRISINGKTSFESWNRSDGSGINPEYYYEEGEYNLNSKGHITYCYCLTPNQIGNNAPNDALYNSLKQTADWFILRNIAVDENVSIQTLELCGIYYYKWTRCLISSSWDLWVRNTSNINSDYFIYNTTNLNDNLYSDIYSITTSNTLNKPSDLTKYERWIVKTIDNVQIAFLKSEGGMALRCKSGNSWTPWNKMAIMSVEGDYSKTTTSTISIPANSSKTLHFSFIPMIKLVFGSSYNQFCIFVLPLSTGENTVIINGNIPSFLSITQTKYAEYYFNNTSDYQILLTIDAGFDVV